MQYLEKESYISSKGSYLLGKDRRGVTHGVFCWSAEQLVKHMTDWRFADRDVTRLTKKLMAHNIVVKSDKTPRVIHGIGARLIGDQLSLMQEVNQIIHPRTNVRLNNGLIYARADTHTHDALDHANVFLYVTPDGQSTLAHVCTQDQAAELLHWEDWMHEDEHRSLVESAIRTLPTIDRFNQEATIINGDLVQDMIRTQLIYTKLFPSTALKN